MSVISVIVAKVNGLWRVKQNIWPPYDPYGCKLCIFQTTFTCKSELSEVTRLRYTTKFENFTLVLRKMLCFIAYITCCL